MKLYILDNSTKRVHEVGTNQHDILLIDERGSIEYYNLQTGCGTFGNEYSFCDKEGNVPSKDSATYKYTGMLILEGWKNNDSN